jgi:peptidyl-prolyl cis-trans isomerase D
MPGFQQGIKSGSPCADGLPPQHEHGSSTMLTSMRKGAANWLAKGLMVILVVAFGLWGVDQWLRGGSQAWVLKVGEEKITSEQIRATARTLNSDPFNALRRLVLEKIGDAEVARLGLGVTNEFIADAISKSPRYRGADGRFDPSLVRRDAQNQNLTESGFIARTRSQVLRNHLESTLTADGTELFVLSDILHKYLEERRTISYVRVPETAAEKVPEPDEAKLKAYYDANIKRFNTEETRKFAYIAVMVETYKKPQEVKDEEVQKEFERNKESYVVPETRKLQRLVLKDKAAADKAVQELKAGKDFLTVGKELGLTEADMTLGETTKAAMLDKKLAEVAFSLAKDTPSDPVQTDFALVIVRATEIKAGSAKTLDDVKKDIVEKIATQKALEELQPLFDKIDSLRGKGRSLAEIAEQTGTKVVEVASVNKTGNGPDGKPAVPLAESGPVVAKVFATDIGEEAAAVELKTGGSVWIDVRGIDKAKPKVFAEIKDELKAAYMAEEGKKALRAFTQKLVARVEKGETLEAIAKELNSKVETTKAVKRFDKAEGLSADAQRLAFGVRKGTAGQADSADGKSRIILRVTDITQAPEMKKEERERSAKAFGREFAQEVYGAYLSGVEKEVGVQVNQAELQKLRTDQQ